MNIEEDMKMLKELDVGDDTEFKQAIENILADRERLEKENTEMQVEIAEQVYFGSMPLEQMKQLEARANKYDALVEKIKYEVKELEIPIIIYGGRGNGKTYARAEKEAKKYILKHILELLEEEEV